MGRISGIGVVIICGFLLTAGQSETRAVLSEQQKESLQTLWSILLAVYDSDISQITGEPNSVIAFGTTPVTKDQLVRAILCLMRHVVDPGETGIAKQFSCGGADNEVSPRALSDSSPIETTSYLHDEDNPQVMVCSIPEFIAEIDNPLGSCVLSPGTYRIQSLPLYIEGHVVIPAGVRLIAPYDPNRSVIEVLPGGRLETGKAAFYTEEDFPDVLPPVEILPEDPNIFFSHNDVGVYVHRGADPRTRLENLEISGCAVGIIIDEQLAYPLRHVNTFGCYDGVQLYVSAEIIDSQFLLNGSIYDEIFSYAGTGVYIRLDGNADLLSEVRIDRTTFYDGDVGLYIDVSFSDPNIPIIDPNQLIPRVTVVNSCIALSCILGIFQASEEALVDIGYCAFGANRERDNVSLPLIECIELIDNPFYAIGEERRLYVYPWSPMVDAGYGIADDGMGTAHDWPDTGRMDIGTHFPLGIGGSFGIPSSPADFNRDGS